MSSPSLARIVEIGRTGRTVMAFPCDACQRVRLHTWTYPDNRPERVRSLVAVCDHCGFCTWRPGAPRLVHP